MHNSVGSCTCPINAGTYKKKVQDVISSLFILKSTRQKSASVELLIYIHLAAFVVGELWPKNAKNQLIS